MRTRTKRRIRQKGHGIDSHNIPSGVDFNALYVAAAKGNTGAIKQLLANQGINIKNILYRAIEHGETDLVRILIQESIVNVNKPITYRFTPIRVAIEFGKIEIVTLLLAHPNIVINKLGLLETAIDKRHMDIVKLLLTDPRIDINEMPVHGGSTPLLVAINNGDTEIVKLLLTDSRLDMNKSVQNNKMTPFLAATENKNIDVINALLADARLNLANNLYPEVVSNIEDVIILNNVLTHPSVASNRDEHGYINSALQSAIKKKE